jgi:hypothetical protein
VPAWRLQQRIAFERFLARLPQDGDWLLKGGFALELRYGLEARSTRDIDLRTLHDPADALHRIRQAVLTGIASDSFSFQLGEVAREMQGAPGGSLRIRVIALLANMELVTFHVDLSSGDAVLGPPDVLPGSPFLAFAGIGPVRFPVYPIAQHLAEKLHAYTLPRAQENTRVRDLADLIIMATSERVEGTRLIGSVDATFATRGTHVTPDRFPEPPASWTRPFSIIAAETPKLSGIDLRTGYALAAAFWSPVLSHEVASEVWMPDQRTWAMDSTSPC